MTKPIAFFDPQEKGFYWAQPTKITAPTIVDVEPLALYTQRTWVGLTEEERKEIWNVGEKKDQAVRALLIQTIRDVEAKLKEKNT